MTIEEMQKRHALAVEALREACSNKFQLQASIPADHKRDHDLLIADALSDIPKLIAMVKRTNK